MQDNTLIREQLAALLEGRDSHMTFAEVTADFPLQAINAKAANVPYSPWHFAEHMRIAQWDILEFIRNPDHVSPDYPDGYRPHSGQEADEQIWLATLRGFADDLQALKDMVANRDTDLYAPLPHAPDYTVFREILVIAAHNSYHLGELAMLRQVLDLWPEDNKYLTGHD